MKNWLVGYGLVQRFQVTVFSDLRAPPKTSCGWSLIKSPLSSLLKRPLSPDSLAFIASPAGIFSAPHFHSRFPEVPLIKKKIACQISPEFRNTKGLSVNNSYNLLVILAITRVRFQLK
ncbi:MAG: hypothetical protein ACI8XO_002486 [Verrucomicrobiales bacterium]|jgi:hypothetical protein